MGAELEHAIRNLTLRFASDLIALVRTSNPDEVARVTRRLTGARRGTYRRSPDELVSAARQIVSLVRAERNGANAETIKAKLGLPSGRISSKLLMKPLAIALNEGWLRKRGVRRQTVYFVP